jgi:hypothetical protein
MRAPGRRLVIAASAVLVSAGAIAASALLARQPGTAPSNAVRPVWTETHWPFPVDPWGKGKAFRCTARDCGGEVNLFVRAKLGFCNCTTGVADDEDLDRMGDLDLIGVKVVPLAAGRPIAVGSMKGRSRAYVRERGEAVISIAFNERCDMVAATVLLQQDHLAAIEPAVMEFLNSTAMLQWTEVTLGL